MKFLLKIKRFSLKTKLLLLSIIVISVCTGLTTNAFSSDTEATHDNIFVSTILNMSLESETDFVPDTIIEGESSQREFEVVNDGILPFQYSLGYQYVSGDEDLCNALQVEVFYQGDRTIPEVSKYSGNLSSLDYNSDGSDPDLENLTDWAGFKYVVSLPAGSNPALENMTCNFNIVVNAWQQDYDSYALGFSDTEVLASTINSGEWFTPTFLGWNLEGSSDLGDIPPYIACPAPGDTVSINGANRTSATWSPATTANVRYIRHNQRPNGYPDILLDGSSVVTLSDPSQADDLSFISSNLSSSYPNNYTNWGSFGANEGEYILWVRAFVDANTNGKYDLGEVISDWSNYCSLTYDSGVTAPTVGGSTITVSNSPARDIENRITNGSFENGLDGWDYAGNVSIVESDALGGQPYHGSKMAMIGSPSNSGDVNVNILSQKIDNGENGLRSIGFWYNFMTYENATGFDEPGFMVFVGDRMVYQVWASDVVTDTDNTTLESTGWKYMSIDISKVEDSTFTLAFYGGNSQDTTNSSFVYLDKIDSNEVIVNNSAVFDVYSDVAGTNANYRYQVNGQVFEGSQPDHIAFSIAAQPDDNKIEYWADGADKQSIYVIYDDTAPDAITDLEAIDEGDGEYTLTFTAPGDNVFDAVSEYDVRYSTEEITDQTDWDSLDQADLLIDDTLHIDATPNSGGNQDSLVVQNLQASTKYYFAVRSEDGAHNQSTLSNIALVNGDIPVSPIVLNEILFNPIGDDAGTMPAGEWVELYNNGDTDLDVTNWMVTDNADHQVVIEKANSDNDLDSEDEGETIVPAQGRLVVYVNGQAIFNNDGDTVTLTDETGLVIDQHAYAGGKDEGNTEARIEEGVGEWIDPIATPGTQNAETVEDLQPQVKLWQQDDTNARFILFDGQKYQDADYIITYTHKVGEDQIQEGLQGGIAINQQGRIEQRNIHFGTCSENGDVCVDHQDIELVSIEVTLMGDNDQQVVSYEYPETWYQSESQEVEQND